MRTLILFLAAMPLWAGTQVADTIKDSSGRAVARGSVTFTPSGSWESAGNTNWVSRAPVSARIASGAFSVTLEPTPAGQCYTLTFFPASLSPPMLAYVPSSGPVSLSQIINASGCTSADQVRFTLPPGSGTYCIQAVDGVISPVVDGVAAWSACSGSSGSAEEALSTLTNSQLLSMTNSQLLALVN